MFKGVKILIDAFKKLDSRNIKLHIIGKGPDEAYFKKIAASDSRITFHGFKSREELIKFYKEANIVVCPSFCLETFGMVILESFMYGTPVIGSKIGAYPDLIINGYNGFLFEVGNVDCLKAILETVINNPSILKNLEDGAFESAKKYELEEHINRLEKLYGGILK
jgi:glycosyltransferase involved in cell wall biosynthesis